MRKALVSLSPFFRDDNYYATGSLNSMILGHLRIP